MASIISTSINLDAIDKTKVIQGKKGRYLNLTIVLNDELDQFSNQGPITISQTKDERAAKAPKIYLGNTKVVWTNGQNVQPAPRDGQPAPQQAAPQMQMPEDDLPF